MRRSGSSRPPLSVVSPAVAAVATRFADATRAVLRFCVDWSEQRHHLADVLGLRDPWGQES